MSYCGSCGALHLRQRRRILRVVESTHCPPPPPLRPFLRRRVGRACTWPATMGTCRWWSFYWTGARIKRLLWCVINANVFVFVGSHLTCLVLKGGNAPCASASGSDCTIPSPCYPPFPPVFTTELWLEHRKLAVCLLWLWCWLVPSGTAAPQCTWPQRAGTSTLFSCWFGEARL